MKPKLYLINGPLGSGKTTLVKFLASQPVFQGVRVIENEYANISVDTETLHSHVEDIKTIAGACICCSTGSELSDTLEDLSSDSHPVIIEATGMANSLKLIEKIILSGQIEKYQIASAIFILDGKEAIENQSEIANHQVEMLAADIVLISKVDLLDGNEFKYLKTKLESLGIKNIQIAKEGKFNLDNITDESKIVDFYTQFDDEIAISNPESSYTIIDTATSNFGQEEILKSIRKIYQKYRIRRIKGNFQSSNNNLHIESTPNQHKITRNAEDSELKIIVIGDDARKIKLSDFKGK